MTQHSEHATNLELTGEAETAENPLAENPVAESQGEGDSLPQMVPQAAMTTMFPSFIRLSIPLLFGRYYMTIVAGKERRSGERLASERNKHPLMTTRRTQMQPTRW